jgi:hypothetical protein
MKIKEKQGLSSLYSLGMFLEAQTLDLSAGAWYTSFKFMNVLQEIAPRACL